MAAEHGDAARRGFWASWPQAGVAAGFLLSAGMLAAINGLLSEADFLAWGWRIPFVASVVLVAVGWYIRNRVAESRLFEEAQAEAETPPTAPALDVLRERPGSVALGIGIKFGENVSYYILTAFTLTFLVDISAQGRGLALNALLVGTSVQFFAILFAAHLSDRIGRRPVYAFGAFGLCAWSFALFALLASGSGAAILLALVVGLVLHGVMYGPQAAIMAELFPTRIRYSGASIAYQFTAIIAGSLAPLIAVWLYREYGSVWPVALYVAVACAISGVSVLLARETKGVELANIR